MCSHTGQEVTATQIYLTLQLNMVIEFTGLPKKISVLIDSELDVDSHIYCKINTANKMLGIIKRNFQNLDTVSFLCSIKLLHTVILNLQELS